MTNSIKGYIAGNHAHLLTPGAIADDWILESGQFGVLVEDVLVYRDLQGLRQWATSLLSQLPADRDEQLLVTVDSAKQTAWLEANAAVQRPEWESNADDVYDLLHEIASDPEVAGWTLGTNVAALWAVLDEDGNGLMTGVRLADSGLEIGTGKPRTDDDFRIAPKLRASSTEAAAGCLSVVVDDINRSY